MNWIQSAMMGFVSGISELMPLSAEAHRGLLCRLMGVETPPPLFLLCTHLAVLTVLLIWGRLDIHRLRRAAKLQKTPTHRRTAHPDLNSMGTNRMLRRAGLLAVLGRLLSYYCADIANRLWLVALPLGIGGFLIWAPSLMRTANKDGRHLTPTEGLLMGLGALAAAVPGISLVGSVTAIASMLGTHRRYAVRLAWILMVYSLVTALGMDILALIGTGFDLSLGLVLSGLVGTAAAALGAYLAIRLMGVMLRSTAGDLTGFCYYNWGQALLCLALFLLV